MPVDPSIYGQLRPPQIESPIDQLHKLYSLREMQQLGQLRQEQTLQRRQAMGAEKALGDSIAKHTTTGPDGQTVVDNDAVRLDLAQGGHGHIIPTFDAGVRQQHKEKIDSAEKELTIAQKKLGIISSALGPAADAEDDGEMQRLYSQNARPTLIQLGLGDEKTLPQFITRDWINQHTQMAVTREQQITNHLNDAKYAKDLLESEDQSARNAPKTFEDWAKIGAQVLGSAQTIEQSNAGMNSLRMRGAPEEYLKLFRDDLTRADDLEKQKALALEMGTTPAEKATEAHRQQQEREAATRTQQNDRRIDLLERGLTDRENRSGPGGQTPNSAAVDRRAAMRDIGKSLMAENKLNRLRGQLGTAISSGKIYVDRNGAVKSMDTASQGDPETKASLIEEMRGRYQDASDELKKTIEDKNDLYERMGSKPKVTTEQAHAAIDAGDQKLFGGNAPQQGGPQGAPVQPAPAEKAGKAPESGASAPVGGYKLGQEITSKGKRYRITGFTQEGKIQAQPIQ